MTEKETNYRSWTLFSNYAHVLICLATDPDMRLRDVAVIVGITERAVQRIVSELEAAEVLSRERNGRRNHYVVHTEKPLLHPLEAHCTIGVLLDTVLPKPGLATKT
jgi:DNA-binding MarR family transcriptional regulator